MRSLSRFVPYFLLTALCAFSAVGQATAQTTAQTPQATPEVAATADFLATLADGQSTAAPSDPGNLLPAPTFMTGCTSSAQCPSGQLCCLACGASDCETRACFKPVRGHCPLFV